MVPRPASQLPTVCSLLWTRHISAEPSSCTKCGTHCGDYLVRGSEVHRSEPSPRVRSKSQKNACGRRLYLQVGATETEVCAVRKRYTLYERPEVSARLRPASQRVPLNLRFWTVFHLAVFRSLRVQVALAVLALVVLMKFQPRRRTSAAGSRRPVPSRPL